MKKLIAVLLALVLCASMASVVMAAEDDFVESITYKPAPGVLGSTGITIIPVSDDKASDDLKDLYDNILNDKEDFEDYPDLEDWVVRDLFEVIVPDGEDLPDEITLDTNFKPGDEVVVLEYKDGKWVKVESKIEDGDLIVKLTAGGPVAILVPGTKSGGAADTGDSTNQQMVLWIAVAALALTTIVVLLAVYRRRETEV